ncbi:hypothetical protein K7X08_027473 [Anisodus acutangulus]|uniref:Gamma-glutamylcyclotransferase n=1 Tax=Anisodus acutangulus TaxID=402998 RepID=A0A9Q1RI97_9SOLA|nr:hypothetical protein K7X08_027473 [Anisodus acutangulus]
MNSVELVSTPSSISFSLKKLCASLSKYLKALPSINLNITTFIDNNLEEDSEDSASWCFGFLGMDHWRVFDLACIDHRGIPEKPARTCTLDESKGAICWGGAYCVQGGPEIEKKAMEVHWLFFDSSVIKTLVDFFTEEDSLHPALTGVIVFTSTPDKEDNKYYLGPAPLEEMARQIATASGPCGNNREYIVKMEKALHDISHEDDYIIELANEVRKVLGITGSVPKEKKLLGPSQIPLKSHISPVKI